MKNYKEMADAVFARRDEYVILQRRKKKIAINASLSLCAVCLAVIGAIGIWKTGIVEPDPDVLGTKPGYIADNTEDTSKHTLSSNATSEGGHSEVTQIIIGTNTSNTVNKTEPAPSESAQNTKSTDPVEKVTKPATKPSVVLPTLPRPPIVLPTLPQAPVATDPVETSPTTNKPSNTPDAAPDTIKPTTAAPVTDPTYWEPETQAPEATDGAIREPQGDTSATDGWVPEEPTTAACWDEPEYTAAPDCTEEAPACTEAPTLPSGDHGDEARPDEPVEEATPGSDMYPTGDESYVSISGKVLDQYGNPVKGCEIWAYNRGMVVATTFTTSNGTFNFRCPRGVDYLVQYSAPDGYTPASYSLPAGGADSVTITFYCTKN